MLHSVIARYIRMHLITMAGRETAERCTHGCDGHQQLLHTSVLKTPWKYSEKYSVVLAMWSTNRSTSGVAGAKAILPVSSRFPCVHKCRAPGMACRAHALVPRVRSSRAGPVLEQQTRAAQDHLTTPQVSCTTAGGTAVVAELVLLSDTSCIPGLGSGKTEGQPDRIDLYSP